MVIDTREAKVLERQVAQFLHGFADLNLSGFYAFEKFFNLFRLNKAPTFLDSTAANACSGRQPVAFASSDNSANIPAAYL